MTVSLQACPIKVLGASMLCTAPGHPWDPEAVGGREAGDRDCLGDSQHGAQ